MSALVLEYMSVRKRESYEGGNGTDYIGTAKFKGEHGTTEIRLDTKLSAEILHLVAASMVRATRELADNMTAEVFDIAHDKLLEHAQEQLAEQRKSSDDDTPF